MVDAFSLKLQRDNRKNALTADPAKGETGKKLYFSPHCGDETTTYFNRAFPKGSAIACCFIPTSFGRLRQRWHCTADPAMSGSEMGGLLHNMVKAGLFLFLLANLMAEATCFGERLNRDIRLFDDFLRLCHGTWLFCFSNILKIYVFSQNFPLVDSVIGDFIDYSLRISRK